jgi:hypothetical protein
LGFFECLGQTASVKAGPPFSSREPPVLFAALEALAAAFDTKEQLENCINVSIRSPKLVAMDEGH